GSQLPEESGAVSPGKRRKFDGNGVHAPRHHGLGSEPNQPFSARTPLLPRPETSCSKNPHYMLPSSRAFRINANPPAHDPSLTLPPLRTTVSPRLENADLETTVMGIPFINKIKTLAKVSPPLTSGRKCRGAVISVEGQNRESIKRIIRYI